MNIKRLLQVINLVILVVLLGLFALSYFNEKGFQDKIEKLTKQHLMLLISLNDMYAQGLQTEQATRNIIINPKDDQAKKNYQKRIKIYEINDEAIRLSSGEMKEQLKKVAQLWQQGSCKKMEIQQLAEQGKKEDAVQKIIEETKLWREIKDIILKALESHKKNLKKQMKRFLQLEKEFNNLFMP